MSAPIEAGIPVLHAAWVPDGNSDAHGNPTGTHADPPVQRYIQDFYPLGWDTSSPDVISADYLSRYQQDMEMMVPPGDAGLYKKQDLVTIHGLAYTVQNRPHDWGQGLPEFAQSYAGMLGGTVHVRRVT